jgi:hypothetical protein
VGCRSSPSKQIVYIFKVAALDSRTENKGSGTMLCRS